MGKITVEALKRGLESLGLEVSSKKQKDLEKQIDGALKDMELGFECPSCSKDIPDVTFCPYCGESFEEEAEETEDVEDAAEGLEETADDSDDSEEMTANEFLNKEIDETSKKVAEKLTEKPKSEAKKSKDAKPVKENKPKAEKKESDKKGREKIPEEVIKQRKEELTNFINSADSIIGDKLEKRERKTGLTYVLGTERLFKIVATIKQIVVEFNVDLKSNVDGLVRYSPEEAKAKHFGSIKSIYSGDNMENALKLIKEAIR